MCLNGFNFLDLSKDQFVDAREAIGDSLPLVNVRNMEFIFLKLAAIYRIDSK